MYICASHECSFHRGQKRAMDSMVLEFSDGFEFYVGFRSQTLEVILATKKKKISLDT